MPDVERLSKYLMKVVESDKYGGRIICVDENTVVLYDCGSWSDIHSEVVHSKYPECEISITPSSSSLSGFVVIAKIHKDKGVFRWVMIAFFLLAVFFSTARHMLIMNTN
jgi:hypothetical protein